MPRAPSYRPNQVAPASTTDARFRAADNDGGAFGAVAKGLQQIGGAVGDFAVTQDQINAENDDTQARMLAAEYGLEASAVTSEYATLQAGAAREAQTSFTERLEKAKQARLEQATTGRMRRLLEQRLTEQHGRGLQSIASHATVEAKKERGASFVAQRDSYAVQAANEIDPGERLKLANSAVAVELDRLSEIGGFDPEATPEIFENAELTVRSGIHQSVLDKMQADPSLGVDELLGYVEANGNEMMPDLKADVLGRLKDPLQQRSARNGADIVMGLMPDLGEATPGQEGSFKFAMPVQGGAIPKGGVFDSPRDGGKRKHAALDISAPIGTPIYSPAPGKVTAVKPLDGASGNWVQVTHPDGSTSTYAHMDKFSVKVGDPVSAGAQLGTVGNTGRGTGPHLHWTVRNAKGERVDPRSLIGTDRPYANAPREHDRETIYRNLDKVAAERGWDAEETDRVRSELDRRVARDEGLLRERYSDAADEATRIIAGLPEGLQDIGQIPKSVRDRMAPTDVARLEQGVREDRRRKAEAAAEKAEAAASSNLKLTLALMQRFEPEKFKKLNLLEYAGKLPAGEFASVFTKQQDMLTAKPKPYDPQERIGGAITRGKTYHGLEIPDEDLPAVYDFMEDYLKRVHEKNGTITLTDADEALKAATGISQRVSRAILPDIERKGYEVTYDDITPALRNSIIRNWKGAKPPTKDDVLGVYRRMQTKAIQ